jgi:hypothetical protein
MAVIVPQSACAPHQVTVKGDRGSTGRDARGNRRLTEGDVARLYARRRLGPEPHPRARAPSRKLAESSEARSLNTTGSGSR